MTTCRLPDFLHRLPAFFATSHRVSGGRSEFHPRLSAVSLRILPTVFSAGSLWIFTRIFSEFTLNFPPRIFRAFCPGQTARHGGFHIIIIQLRCSCQLSAPCTAFLLLSALARHCTIALFCLFHHIPAHHVHKSPFFRTNPRE